MGIARIIGLFMGGMIIGSLICIPIYFVRWLFRVAEDVSLDE